MPFRPEPLDIVIILLAAILLFGPSRLPEIGRGLGKAITEFRRGITGKADDDRADANVPDPSSQPANDHLCAQCGAANPSGARFCNKCGAQLPT
jgi:sec-independent protein translocase protein TatA